MHNASKKILVTGGCGFIGSNFVRHMYMKYPSYEIVNYDLLSYAGNLENLSDIEAEEKKAGNRKRYQFIKGDICDIPSLEKIFSANKFDLVVHFAAESHVDRSIFSDTDFVRTNIEGTRSLVEVSRKHNIGRFIHISTDEIYGSVESGFADEEYPLQPSNPYAASKAGGDLLMQSYMKTFLFPAIIVRGSNNYGPYQYPEKLIPLAITNLLESKAVPIHGDGRHKRSWLHVMDFCRAIDLIAHDAEVFSIYNVSGDEKTNMEVLEAISKKIGMSLDRHMSFIKDRPGADVRYAPIATKLRKELGWRPAFSFDSCIGEVVEWYMHHAPWWKAVRLKSGFRDHYERQSKGEWC